jgi:thermopsin
MSVVNPKLDHSVEPAPMGLADFGVAANGTGYSYSTAAFLGTISIQSLQAHYKFTSGGNNYYGTEISLQLNAELVLSHPGKTNVSYWMQDVVIIETATNEIAFNNNIWNFSSGSLPSSSLSGNGSIESGSVYADVATGYPGTDVVLQYPVNVSAKMVASTIDGVPQVGFQYSDGFGWVTYDNVSLPWARAWTCDGFVVDGFAYTPLHTYFNVEWTEGGPGDGISDTQDKGNFTMGLDYWNGHNFQAIENAYNFGGNTAEGMQNVLPDYAPSSDGLPLVHEAAATGGHLGMVYNRSDVALLSVRSLLPESNLTVGPDSYRVLGGEVNLTLAPGTYALTLTNGTQVADRENVTLAGGESLAVALGHVYFPVWFNETGLPRGTPWTVTLANQSYPSSNASLELRVWNGTYAYSIPAVAGYHLVGLDHAGTIRIAGPTVVSLTWAPVVYAVTATSEGLPMGVPWSVTIDNATHGSTNGTLAFSLPNGTFPYTVEVAYQFLASDPSDMLRVDGQPAVLDVSFAPRYATLSGTVSPPAATLWLNGVQAETGEAHFSVSTISGFYGLTATLAGYHTYYANVTLTPGNTTVQNVVLVALPANASHSGPNSSGAGWTSTNSLEAVGAGIIVVAVVAGVALLRGRPGRKA